MKKEQEIIDYYQREIQKKEAELASLEAQSSALNLASSQILADEPGMMKEQLSMKEELSTIDYLLRSWTLQTDPNSGQQKWVPPKDEDDIILSDYGINLFREVLSWYLNKNHLLSFYTEEQIMDKMKDFATTLNDEVFLAYERIFRQPSIERCKEEFDKRIREKAMIRKYALQLLGRDEDINKLSREVIEEMEGKVEKELMKIRQSLMKTKYKRFLVIMRAIQDTVHSVYLRALHGEERKTLRKHMQVSEIRGGVGSLGNNQYEKKRGGILGWMKRY